MEHVLVETWIKNLPLLGKAYQAKEAFFAVYEQTSRVQRPLIVVILGLTMAALFAARDIPTPHRNPDRNPSGFAYEALTNAQ